MTRNQIAFWEHVETQRSNRAREEETHRANVAHELETQRHNLVNENLGFATLRETERHNREYLSEINRHNVESENQARANLAESVRHNVETENLGYYSTDVNAQTSLQRTLMELNQSKYNAKLSAATSRLNTARSSYASLYGADLGYKAAQLKRATDIDTLTQRAYQFNMDIGEKRRSNLENESLRRWNAEQDVRLRLIGALNDTLRSKTGAYDLVGKFLSGALRALGG